MGLEIKEIHDCHATPHPLTDNRRVCSAVCCPLNADIPEDWKTAVVYIACPKTHTVKEN